MAQSTSSPFRIQVVKAASVPRPPINDTWTNLAPSPAETGSWYWTKQVVNKNTGIVLIPGFGGNTKTFNVNGTFAAVSPSRWGSSENYDLAHDAAHGRIWVTGQAPTGLNRPSGGGGYFNETDPGANSFTNAPSLVGGANTFIGIAQNRLICSLFGLTAKPTAGFRVTDLDTLTATTVPCSGTGPPILPVLGTNPMERLGMIDRRTGQAYVVIAGELYVCNGILAGAGVWSHVPTFGSDKPTADSLVFCFLPESNMIVGWCGINKWTTDDAPGSPPTPRQTWVLNLGTLVWRLGPGLLAGTPAAQLPPAEVASYNSFIHNPVRQSAMLLISGSGTGQRVWEFQLAGPIV